jgi:UDP-N-acetylmuramoylalanine--D-glutamate ligase
LTGPGLTGRIAVLGAGREGIAAYEHLSAIGAGESIQVITEALSGHEKEASLQAAGVLKICPFNQAGLDGYDFLVRSPGVSAYRQCLQSAVDAGVRIITPSSIWFAEHPGANTIVISGTKGKSTTAALLAHLLGKMGERVQLAGNIGTPLLACDERDVDWWVIELSSFQLADLEAQPTVGVLLNLATDHIDWHGTEARYHSDKLRIADLVETGHLIANGLDPNLRKALSDRAGVIWFNEKTYGISRLDMPPSLPGKHNRSNEGLPHRLKRVGVFEGVEYIDDSISTAPVATLAALEAFRDRFVVLLVGGYERGIEWAPYAGAIGDYPPKAVIALPDNGPRIVKALEKAGVEPELGTVLAGNLGQALEAARRMAPDGGVVLLSPGAPSFPHFKDYEDRGRQFTQLCSAADVET